MSKEFREQAKPLAVEGDWKKIRLAALHVEVLALDEGTWVTYLPALKRLASGFGVEREMANLLAGHLPTLHFDDLNREGEWRINIGFSNALWSAITERDNRDADQPED